MNRLHARRSPAALLLTFALAVFAIPNSHAQTTTTPANTLQAQTVSADFVLKPSTITAAGSFRLLFVTNSTITAVSDDISIYNTHVQTSAADGHSAIQAFSGEFRALVSSSVVDARDNTATNHVKVSADPDAPIYWLNGDKVADDYADFYDGGWDSIVATDRSGNRYSFTAAAPASHQIWTGSNPNGTKRTGFFIGSDLVGTGVLQAGEEILTGTVVTSAAVLHPLYALSPLLTLNQVPTVATTIADQRAFVDDAFTYTFPANTFADADGDILTYSVSASPTATWLSLDADTGAFSGTPPSPGAFTITVTASDGIDSVTDEFILTTMLSNPPQAQIVSADFALKPSTITAGGSFRLLFLTTQTTQATSTDIATYNTHVQTSAAGGHAAIQAFSGEFRALISTENIDARDNTASNRVKASPDPDAPIYWLSGDQVADKVADDYADFYDGDWDSTNATDQNGDRHGILQSVGRIPIWTGTDSDGTEFFGPTDPSISRAAGERVVIFTVFATAFSADPGGLSGTQGANNLNKYPLFALSPLLTVASTDATLIELNVTPADGSALTLTRSDGNTPGFDTAEFTYTANAPSFVPTVTVAATATDDGASIQYAVGDPASVMFTSSSVLTVVVGNNNILTVRVTAEDGVTTQDYTITLTVPANSDATLSALSVTPAGGMALNLTPMGNSTTVFTATAPTDTTMVTVAAAATDSDSASVQYAVGVNPTSAMFDNSGVLTVVSGDNTLTVRVTAEDGSVQDYTITLTVLFNSDVTLRTLSVTSADGSTLTLTPMGSTTTVFTAPAPTDTTMVTVVAIATDSNASVQYAVGVKPASASFANSGDLPVAGGENTLTVRVTAEDDSTIQDYTITLTVITDLLFKIKVFLEGAQ